MLKLTCEKHLHDRIISQRGAVWVHKARLTLPLFLTACTKTGECDVMYLCVPKQESVMSCICVYQDRRV